MDIVDNEILTFYSSIYRFTHTMCKALPTEGEAHLPTTTVLDVRDDITARIRGLLGSASGATTDHALAHFDYLWSDGSCGAYSDNAHSVVWFAVTEAYAAQGLTDLHAVPRMLRGAASQAQRCPLP